MSLKAAAKERLLWAIRQVVVPFGRVVMLVDQHSLRVVSACCTVSELLDEGVDLVELITKRRQPMKKKVAVYLLSEDMRSVEHFLEDFKPRSEKYKSAFLMFNCHLDDDLALRKIAEEVDTGRVLGCVELHLNFIAYEERVFHGNMGFTLLSLYPTHIGSIAKSIASRLASLCSVLGSMPQIRYQAVASGLPQLVAKATSELIMATADEVARKPGDVLLVLDRSIDPVPLHIHEYTYQAFVYDVLRIPCCSDPVEQRKDDVWEFDYVACTGKRENRGVMLSGQTDVLWTRFKHLHIQKVNEVISEEVEKFAGEAANGALNNAKNTREVLKAVRELPKTRYLVEKYYAHITLTERSFEQLEAKNLVKVGELEQDLATNVDRNGNKLSHTKALQQLNTLLEDVGIDDETKMRLILLYVSVYRNVTQTHVAELLTTARLSSLDATVVEKFVELGLGSVATPSGAAISPRSASSSKVSHRLHDKCDAHTYYKKHARGGEYELSRYMPDIMHVIGRVVSGTLEDDKFPRVQTDAADKQQSPRGGRVIVYIVGGITFSEMRTIYDMAEKMQADLYLGGDSILVPSNVLENMKHAFSAVEKA
ncbi:syntaxin binding protein, putative [Babesia bigemina]|uniref:Syntaxin binding protein, putative n=1 Tax=Babesia bigemina TaxID=5866 RepID=A0A061D9C1_BABBI|nr:syntaxin binding protein, putative [Babesia bigemina]CDR95519.1 syntaxin binding protein, putative [Babesia bigemina]|eukprot:XP_012767705.1 syntaxin binding protein, putative [Babesia bigemina]